jgi:hypothetical protein
MCEPRSAAGDSWVTVEARRPTDDVCAHGLRLLRVLRLLHKPRRRWATCHGMPMLPTPPCYLARYQRSRATQGYQVKVLMQLHGAGDALRAPYYCGLRRGTTTPIPAPSPSCRRAAGAHLARHAPPSGIAALKIRRPFPSRTLALRPHTSLFLLPALLQRQFWSWPGFSVDFPKPILTHIAPPLPSPHPPAPSPRTTIRPLSTPLPS